MCIGLPSCQPGQTDTVYQDKGLSPCLDCSDHESVDIDFIQKVCQMLFLMHQFVKICDEKKCSVQHRFRVTGGGGLHKSHSCQFRFESFHCNQPASHKPGTSHNVSMTTQMAEPICIVQMTRTLQYRNHPQLKRHVQTTHHHKLLQYHQSCIKVCLHTPTISKIYIT